MSAELSRRDLPAAVLGLAAAVSATRTDAASPRRSKPSPFTICLNTSTISGQKLPISEVVEITAKAGYSAIEPWIRELEVHKAAGKSLNDLRKQIADAGLSVESAIGFAEWSVDDESRRKKGLDGLKRDMDLVRQIGGKRIAAPPVGMTDRVETDVRKLGDRYRVICEIGESMGITPQAEVWGFSKTMSRLGEVTAILIESGHPRACLLPDIYHLHKGGSGFDGLRLLGPSAIQVFHLNDYPAAPPRETITDAHRVYPGDGVAPIVPVIRRLLEDGYKGVFSLELFNRDYWKQDAFEVASTGFKKMKAVVDAAITTT